MCGSYEILRNVVGKKHAKHENVATEPRSPGNSDLEGTEDMQLLVSVSPWKGRWW